MIDCATTKQNDDFFQCLKSFDCFSLEKINDIMNKFKMVIDDEKQTSFLKGKKEAIERIEKYNQYQAINNNEAVVLSAMRKLDQRDTKMLSDFLVVLAYEKNKRLKSYDGLKIIR